MWREKLGGCCCVECYKELGLWDYVYYTWAIIALMAFDGSVIERFSLGNGHAANGLDTSAKLELGTLCAAKLCFHPHFFPSFYVLCLLSEHFYKQHGLTDSTLEDVKFISEVGRVAMKPPREAR